MSIVPLFLHILVLQGMMVIIVICNEISQNPKSKEGLANSLSVLLSPEILTFYPKISAKTKHLDNVKIY
jgi:hypothetical protein